MGILTQRLALHQPLVADGAWGTLLIGMGLTSTDLPEEWNVSHPKEVQSVATAYAKAGADVILSDTFGGTSIKLTKAGFAGKVQEFNCAGARNSLVGAPHALVVASVGPTGEFLEPVGEMTATEMEAVFKEQIQALYDAGIRAVDIETMSALDEALCAARAAKSVSADMD
ncbi:MAG: homocysteine S-methyltransferase family protein, partial [Planctomycetota bacterium]